MKTLRLISRGVEDKQNQQLETNQTSLVNSLTVSINEKINKLFSGEITHDKELVYAEITDDEVDLANRLGNGKEFQKFKAANNETYSEEAHPYSIADVMHEYETYEHDLYENVA